MAELAAPCPEEGPSEEADMAEVDLEDDLEDDHIRCQRLLTERWVAEDQCRYTIFEDMEDELSYHKRRSRALCCFVRAYATLREDYDHLQEGGLGLQDAYEQLQDELREAVGDVAYWQELAEARGEDGSSACLPAAVSVDAEYHDAEETEPEVVESSAVDEELVQDPATGIVSNQEVDSVEPHQVEADSHDSLVREMLKDSRSQVTRWRKLAEKNGKELNLLQAREQARARSNSPARQLPATPESGARWHAGAGYPAAVRLPASSPGLPRPSSGRAYSPAAYSSSFSRRASALQHQTPPRAIATSSASNVAVHPPSEASSVAVLSRSASEPQRCSTAALTAHARLVRGAQSNDGFVTPPGTPPSELDAESPATSALPFSPSSSVSSKPPYSRPPEATVVGILGRSASAAASSAARGCQAGACLGGQGREAYSSSGFRETSPHVNADRAPSAAVAALTASPAPLLATNRRILFTSAAPMRSPEKAQPADKSSGSVGTVPSPARAWGPGSAPRRCPGLGIPTRRSKEQPLGGSSTSERPRNSVAGSQQPPASVPSARPRPSVTGGATSPSSKGARRMPVSIGQPNRRSSTAPNSSVGSGTERADSPRSSCRTPPHYASGSRAPLVAQVPFRPPPSRFGHGSPEGGSSAAPLTRGAVEGLDEEFSISRRVTDLVGLKPWQPKGPTR